MQNENQNENKKDFDTWSTLKKSINSKEDKTLFHEGEIWWCSIGLNIGVEIDGKNEDFERPVFIYKKINSQSFIGVPVTSRVKNNKYYLSIKIKNKDTYFCFNQIKTFSSKRLLRKLSKISDSKYDKISLSFKDLIVKNRNPLSGISQVPNGNNIISIAERDILSNGYFELKIGDKFRHYKTKDIYVIFGVTKLQAPEDTGLDMVDCVIYKKEDRSELWTRPIKMFLEEVTNENGGKVQRFTKIEN